MLLAAAFKIVAPLILVLPGMMAFYLDSSAGLFSEEQLATMTAEGESKFAELAQDEASKPEESEGEWIANYVAGRKNDKAYGALVRKVLPDWLNGFFAAVMIGAILSSFNSALNATATLFSLGMYRKIKPNAKDSETVFSGQIFGTIIAIAAMCVAPLLAGQDSIFGYLQKMNGLYFIPIFSVVLMGMFSKKTPAWSANSALVVGFLAIGVGYFVFPQHVDAIHEFHFLGVVFATLVVLMAIAGFVAPDPMVRADDEDEAPIPMKPWGGAWPVGIFLIVSVLAIYMYFAQ